MGRNRAAKKLNEELFLAPQEAAKILAVAKERGPEWYLPLFIPRYTGLRCIEMLHIRVRDIRFDLNRIFCWTAKTKTGAVFVGCTCGGYTENKGVRDSVPFKKEVGVVLRGWIEYHMLSPDDWIFPSRKNRMRHLSTARIRQIFDDVSRWAKVPKVPQRGIHSLRHLVGTEVAELTDGNPFKVQKFLRQSNVASAEAYVHVRNLAKIAEGIGEVE